MKKIAVLLVFVMVMLVACSGGDKSDKDSGDVVIVERHEKGNNSKNDRDEEDEDPDDRDEDEEDDEDDEDPDDRDEDDPVEDAASYIKTLCDEDGNPWVDLNIPGYYTFDEESSPDDLLFTGENGGVLTIGSYNSFGYEDVLKDGREMQIGNYTAFSNWDGREYEYDDDESFPVSHTVIFLGQDEDNGNQVFSVVTYGDMPLTYRYMYVKLAEDRWVTIYSSDFQQSGVDNTEAIANQLELYNILF